MDDYLHPSQTARKSRTSISHWHQFLWRHKDSSCGGDERLAASHSDGKGSRVSLHSQPVNKAREKEKFLKKVKPFVADIITTILYNISEIYLGTLQEFTFQFSKVDRQKSIACVYSTIKFLEL